MTIDIEIGRSKRTQGEYALFITSRYNSEFVDYVRDLSDRFWHNNVKQWEVNIEFLEDFILDWDDCDLVIHGEYVEMQRKKAYKDVDFFDFKTTPYEHQKECFLYGMNHERWLLADQMGMGKTKQSIDIACAKKQEEGFIHCLIICGVNGLKWNWRKEIALHSNESGYILGTRIRKRKKVEYIGSNADKNDDLQKIRGGEISDYFIITNVESLRNASISDSIKQLVDDKIINMIIVDECHKAGLKGNPNKSQQGKALLKFRPRYRLAMTGTPIMNEPLDMYGILYWLGYENHSFYQFTHHYAEFGGYGGYEVVKYVNMNELESKVSKIMLRRLKKDYLDLPDKVYINEFVEMPRQQQIIYNEVMSEIKLTIDKISTSLNPLAEMTRLRQATGYTGILSTRVGVSAKLDRMKELVDDIYKSGEKVLIFSNWTNITDAVNKWLSDYNCLTITGDTPDELRQEYVEIFQNDSNYTVMIGTTGALGTGLTLTAANNVIFVDEPWSTALKEQAIDRIHRIGQKNDANIYTIMCEGTIDERVHELVEKKGKYSDAIVDGEINDMSKSELVEFLLS